MKKKTTPKASPTKKSTAKKKPPYKKPPVKKKPVPKSKPKPAPPRKVSDAPDTKRPTGEVPELIYEPDPAFPKMKAPQTMAVAAEQGNAIDFAAAAFGDDVNRFLDEPAERDAVVASNAMVESERLLDAAWKGRDESGEIRELTDREKEKLAFYELQIDQGLKRYVNIGKYLFAIWSDGLHQGSHKAWRDYTRERWNMTASGSYDLMKAFRTWRLATSAERMSFREAVEPNRWLETSHDVTMSEPEQIAAEVVIDAEPTDDAAAPSQRSIEELSRVSSVLAKDDMSDAEFQEFERVATRAVYEMIREFDPTGKFTQATVRETIDAFLEFSKTRAFEIDGEHYAGGKAAEFRITRGLFEQLAGERDAVREMLEKRRKRMSESQERTTNEFSFVPPDKDGADLTTPTIAFACSHHGEQAAHKFMFGAVQLKCGDVFGMPRGGADVLFNPKLTKDNPIEDGGSE